MRKYLSLFILFLFSSMVFAEGEFGIVGDDDFIKAGVSNANIAKAKDVMEKIGTKTQLLLLEKKQLELQVNKYALEGSEKNLAEIDKAFDKMGEIEASLLKERIRSQIQIQKFISQEQYMKAREIAISRMNRQGK